MKKIIKIALLASLFYYLVNSFIDGNFNPRNWQNSHKIVFIFEIATMWFLCFGVWFGIYIERENQKKDNNID